MYLIHHELGTGLADRLLGGDHTADKEQFFHVTVTETEAERQPDGMADALIRQPMMFVGIGRGWGRHGSSIPEHGRAKSAHSSREELLGRQSDNDASYFIRRRDRF